MKLSKILFCCFLFLLSPLSGQVPVIDSLSFELKTNESGSCIERIDLEFISSTKDIYSIHCYIANDTTPESTHLQLFETRYDSERIFVNLNDEAPFTFRVRVPLANKQFKSVDHVRVYIVDASGKYSNSLILGEK